MRKVIVSTLVQSKICELNLFLTREFMLSWTAAEARVKRMENFIASLRYEADYPLCRFKQWRALSYRCVVFEQSWVFVYEIVQEGVVIRDMSHTTVLAE